MGDVAEMVSEENRPYIAAQGDDAALSQALAALVADPALRQRLGAANRARAAADYAERVMAKRNAEAYGRVLPRQAFS